MTERPVNAASAIHDRIHAEMLDSFDEELELEIDDDRLDALTNEFSDHTAKDTVDRDRKSTRLNSSHMSISYAVFCSKKKKISTWRYTDTRKRSTSCQCSANQRTR